ncbi:MAG: class I SAM-dependent methyltransferase [Bryobacteraceae bacterium]
MRSWNADCFCSCATRLQGRLPFARTVTTFRGQIDWWVRMSSRAHWDAVYNTRAPDKVSWFEPHLKISLDLIERAAPGHLASVIDVGGGESTLVDDLLERGYRNVTVLNISDTALEATRKRLGPDRGRQVRWLLADITHTGVLPDFYDVWHDRAVFHFLTERSDRVAYIQNVIAAVKPGGHVIVSTFGPEGPIRCSGLSVMRFDAGSLHREFGAPFRLIESCKQLHTTPFGTTQQFLYCYCRVE